MYLIENRSLLKVKFNWATICLFAFFWSYGFFATLITKNFTHTIIITLALSFVLFCFIKLSRNTAFTDSITISRFDLVTFFSYAALLFPIAYSQLFSSLVCDQIAHSMESHMHALKVLMKVAPLLSFIQDIPFVYLVWLFNILLLSVALVFIFFLQSRSILFNSVLLILLFIGFRIIQFFFGDYMPAHPPLRLFPLWLSSTLFTPSNFSFRIIQFLGLLCMMCFAQRLTRVSLGTVISWLFGLAIGTIPLLLHVSLMAEQSIWSSMIWSLFILVILTTSEFNQIFWIRWISLMALFTLLRQPTFIGLVPLVLLFLRQNLKKDNLKNQNLFLIFSPLLVMLPFLINSLIFGTPSTYKGDSSFFPNDASSISRVIFAFQHGIVPWIVFQTTRLPLILFLFALLPISFRNRSKLFIHLIILLFFAIATVMFFVIIPCNWGADRYVAEYCVPFIIGGIFVVMRWLYQMTSFLKKMTPVLIVFLIVLNIVNFFRTQYSSTLTIGIFKISINTEQIYDYSSALNEVKKAGFAGNSYIAGITYGYFPEILSKFTTSEVLRSKKINDSQWILKKNRGINWTDSSPSIINEDKNIKVVLVSDIINSNTLCEDLKSSGWTNWKNFTNNRSKCTIYGFIRTPQNEN